MEPVITISRETEFYQGCIRFKMSVTNESSYVINDVTLDFIYEDNLLHIADHDPCPVKNGKFMLGNIFGKKSKSFTIHFDPLSCTGAADIKCQVNYADHEGNMVSVWMEPEVISVVCPIMKTDQDINIGRLKEFIDILPVKDSRIYEVQSGFDVKKLAFVSRQVVEKHDVRHIGTLYTRDGQICEIWYYGRTKVKEHDIVLKISIFTEHHIVELFAATQTDEALTGLLAEVGRELKDTVESRVSGRGSFNLNISKSKISRSDIKNLLDQCNMDGTCDVNIVIDKSEIDRTSFDTSTDENGKFWQQEENLISKEKGLEKDWIAEQAHLKEEQNDQEKKRRESVLSKLEEERLRKQKEREEQNKVAQKAKRKRIEELEGNKKALIKASEFTEDQKQVQQQRGSIPSQISSQSSPVALVSNPVSTRRKLLFVPLMVILVLVGYWMFSPLIEDNSDSNVATSNMYSDLEVSPTISTNVSDISTDVPKVGTYFFEENIGSGAEDEGFTISAVAIDPSGNIYVADENQNCIQEFDSSGNIIGTWGSEGSGEGEFSNPVGVAVDPSGNIYVADSGNFRIQKFDSSGTFITTWGSEGTDDGEFGTIPGIAIDNSGNVYVADSRNSCIQKFDSNGNFITKWNSSGNENQRLSPNGIGVDSLGIVYVTEFSSIKTFDSNGDFIAEFISSDDDVYIDPKGIAIDSSGNVYVADSTNSCIQKFDDNGNIIETWGSEGIGEGKFMNLCGVVIDSSGNVYVADSGDSSTANSCIQKFDSSGNFISRWDSGGSGEEKFSKPVGVAVDSSGNIYVSDSDNSRLQKFDSSGKFITKWGYNGEGDGEFKDPSGIAVDSSGNVYVADTGNSRIQKFDSSGNFITNWGSEGTGNEEFSKPIGVAVDSSGNVYVADSVDSYNGNSRVQKFDSNGNFITKWGYKGSDDGEFDDLSGIAVDSSGNVYVADSGNSRIQKFDNGGTFLTKWNSSDSYDQKLSRYISGVAVDSSGNVYVVDDGNSRIYMFDSSGELITGFGSMGSDEGEFSRPVGVAVDASGNVYVADSGNNCIMKFTVSTRSN